MSDPDRLDRLTSPGFAIIGPGIAADLHLQAIASCADLGARLIAIGHYDPARFDDLSERFGVPCQTFEDILARDDVDVVAICTPSALHVPQTIAAARAGKHILVEKPMALDPFAADRMIAACDAAGVKLGVTYQRRGAPLFQRVHEAITAGDLGTLTHAVVTIPYYRSEDYYGLADWRGIWAMDGGGALINQGIHLVDLLVWYLGDPVVVQAQAATLQRRVEVEDTLVATLRFENGALATLAATTTAAPGFPHRIEIYGTGGAIQIEGEAVVRWTLRDPGRAQVAPINPAGFVESSWAGGDRRAIRASGHAALFRDFIHAIREDRVPLCDGREGRRSLAAVRAIYAAAGIGPA